MTGLDAAALAPFRTGRGAIEVSGDPLTVAPSVVISLSMMLHELATNAAKYGALSVPGGRITIAWRVAAEADGSTVVLDWTEANGPPVTPPAETGFGTRLLQSGAEQLGGECVMRFETGGLRCTIRFVVPPTAPLAARRAPSAEPADA